MMPRTDTDLAQLIAAEAEAAEQSREDSGPSGRRRSGTKTEVYSVRLTREQVDQIAAIAERHDIPPSALVRDWVVQRLRAESAATPTTVDDAEWGELVQRLMSSPTFTGELSQILVRMLATMSGEGSLSFPNTLTPADTPAAVKEARSGKVSRRVLQQPAGTED